MLDGWNWIEAIRWDLKILLCLGEKLHVVLFSLICKFRFFVLFVFVCRIPSIVSFTYTVLTYGDAQGDDEENSLPHLDHGFHSKLPPGILPHGLPTVKEVAPAITPQEKKDKEEEKKESKTANVSDLKWRILFFQFSFY